MKRFILVIPVIIFPYIVAIPPLLMFYTSLTDMPIVDLPYLCVSYLFALGCSAASIAVGLKKGWDAREMLRISRLVKLLHIPAYILIFFSGFISVASLFFAPFAFILYVLNCLTIFTSGLLGVGGIVRGVKEGQISKKTAVAHGVLQFIFCVDVVSSVVLYRRVKKRV